jgi:subtilisin family serine protease
MLLRWSKLVFLFLLPCVHYAQSLGFALEQINADMLISQGLDGSGVKVGIIDGGFLGANDSPSLSNHFQEGRVAYYRDFISPEMAAYSGSTKLNDDHGTQVWELIGGSNTETGIQLGLATGATYYLARTDHGVKESRQEEKYLIQAMDEMINQGVRLFNISLGYTNQYNDSRENYTPDQIDGKSSWITHSLDSLLAIHDVLVIISAGNDGDARWKVLSAPADSKNVLTVGAAKLMHWESMKYSSIGPNWLGYVKPDVSCYSSEGTSFSAPIITGLVACIMQYDSSLKPSQIKDLIMQSSHLYPFPNNLTGYGVPTCDRLSNLLNGTFKTNTPKETTKRSYSINLSGSSWRKRATVYHKQYWRVIHTDYPKLKNKLRIKRPKDVNQSTVLLGNQALEIMWE